MRGNGELAMESNGQVLRELDVAIESSALSLHIHAF